MADVVNSTASDAYIKTACYMPGMNHQGATFKDASASCSSLGMQLYKTDSSDSIQTLENLANAKFGNNSQQLYVSGLQGNACAVFQMIDGVSYIPILDCTTYRGFICEFLKTGR